jgi:hypothetical protein
MLCSSGLIGCDYKMVHMIEVRVLASPYIAREAGLQVGLGREYWSGTSRSSLHGTGHAQLPIRVLLLRSPCAPRHQVPCDPN